MGQKFRNSLVSVISGCASRSVISVPALTIIRMNRAMPLIRLTTALLIFFLLPDLLHLAENGDLDFLEGFDLLADLDSLLNELPVLLGVQQQAISPHRLPLGLFFLVPFAFGLVGHPPITVTISFG